MQRIGGRPDGVQRTRPGRAVAPGRHGRVCGPDGQIAPRPGEIVESSIYVTCVVLNQSSHSPRIVW
jgi:hypothetical protein